MSAPAALFVTSFQQSLGETYTLSRFAAELRGAGWRTPFLASAFATGFLDRQGTPVEPLVESREANRETFFRALDRWRPEVVVSVDPYLFWATDARKWWSTDWLLEPGLPVITFDHLKFHPGARDIHLVFLERFRLDPCLAAALKGVPEGSTPRSVVQVEPLGEGFTTLVRPCPVHDPTPPADDPRIRTYDATRGEAEAAADPGAVRERLGLPRDDKVIVLPAGSWAMELATVLRLPYPALLARLLLRYLEPSPRPVHLVFVGSELTAARETHGASTVRMIPGMPFHELRDLLATADLVLGDNASSATLGRAVMAGVVGGTFLGSVEAVRHGDGAAPRLEAPHPLSPWVRRVLEDLERDCPGSVFPFSVYPLGWRREMEPLFAGNPYSQALAWMELYDEEATSRRLLELLYDDGVRSELRAHGHEYRRRIRLLPGAVELVDATLASGVAA